MRDRQGGLEGDRLTRREALEELLVVGKLGTAAEEGVAFEVKMSIPGI